MFNVQTKIIVVITGEIEAFSKSFRICLSKIPGKHVIKALQRITILGTAHTLWEGTNVNAQKNQHGK
jgi:hypothetical protein